MPDNFELVYIIGETEFYEIKEKKMTDWIEDNRLNRTTKSLIIGWIVLLFGIVQLVAGLLSIVVLGVNPTAIFLCFLGGVAGAIGLTSVLIGSIRSK